MNNIVNLKNITHQFHSPDQSETLILEKINLTLESGKIVALLGKSGSGKSTLLRIVSGLIKPTSGEVYFNGKLVDNSVYDASMVFQNFALFPWMTIQENIAIGIETRLPKNEVSERVKNAIKLIGLEGYEGSFPKELSGGMKQRVGIARALVTNPKLLLMDEPFSALDVLTSENLKNDLIDIWQKKLIPLDAILIVTHNIEEAIFLADEVIVLSSNPGKIINHMDIKIPHPRNKSSSEFQKLTDELHKILMSLTLDKTSKSESGENKNISKYSILNVMPLKVLGFLEMINLPENNGEILLSVIKSGTFKIVIDELPPIIELSRILGLITLNTEYTIAKITEFGKKVAESAIKDRKSLMSKKLSENVDIIKLLIDILSKKENKECTIHELSSDMSKQLDNQQPKDSITNLIAWGRFTGIISYDNGSKIIKLKSLPL